MTVDTNKPALQTVGKYNLLEKIAEGGMGTVYKARDTSTSQLVAIKIVPPQVAKNPILMKRFEQEYAVASTLNHPNMVRALDYGAHGTTPFLVMEYVEGESLGQRIERDGMIPEAEAIRIIAQVAQALHKAHKKGLVHRDVKPDNVLITADGTAKLADLGLVKELETDLNLTRTGRGLGTPHFMAPEQFRNAKNADARCDIYSLAATLYNMVTGELPFKSSGPLDAWMKKINNELVPAKQLSPDLSERLDWALRRSMSVDRDHRPTNCREFVEDLTGHSTRKIFPSTELAAHDTWYLYYTDDENVTRTVRGTLQGIRHSLKEGVLGDASNVRAARTKSGPFEALRNHPEFRDLVITLQQEVASQTQVKSGISKGDTSVALPATSTPPDTPAFAGGLSRGPASTPQRTSTRASGVNPRPAPHIHLATTSQSFPWVTLGVVLFCALCLGGAAFVLLPLLTH